MSKNILWALFPYPTMSENLITDGSVIPAHPDCIACPTRECASETQAPVGEARQCRFGLTFAKIDATRNVVGVIGSDFSNPSSRSRRRYAAEASRRVPSAHIHRAVKTAIEMGTGLVEDFDRSKEEVLSRLEHDPEMHRALANELRKEFQDNLDQSHDFLQLVKLIRGHAEVLIHDKYPTLDVTDAAERLPTEGAIYFSTELMLVKMNALIFLQEINRALGGETKFQIHPFILKYARIYKWQAEQKGLTISLEGRCFAHTRYNNQAIGALIQGLFDNLVKYAPADSKATIVFDEQANHVALSFASLGPKIEPGEHSQIFLPGFRGRAARAYETTGMGVGLATAKQVSDALDLGLVVEQEEAQDPRHAGKYLTTFSFRLERNV